MFLQRPKIWDGDLEEAEASAAGLAIAFVECELSPVVVPLHLVKDLEEDE